MTAPTITRRATYDLQLRYNGPIPKSAYSIVLQTNQHPHATVEEIEAVIAEFRELVRSSFVKCGWARAAMRRAAREGSCVGLQAIFEHERLQAAQRELLQRWRLRNEWIDYRDSRLARGPEQAQAAE